MTAPQPATAAGDTTRGSAETAQTAGDELVAAWQDALDVLERDARAAAELAKDPSRGGAALTAWTPPTPGGPVPDVLVDRVRELLRLQAAVRADLDLAMGENRASVAGLERTTSTARPRTAAYVDVSA